MRFSEIHTGLDDDQHFVGGKIPWGHRDSEEKTGMKFPDSRDSSSRAKVFPEIDAAFLQNGVTVWRNNMSALAEVITPEEIVIPLSLIHI